MGIGTGTSADDYLYGGKGEESDTMSGRGGNDTLNGRGGLDVAVFSGSLADYVVTYDDALGAYVLADKMAGRDGTDTVLETESFQFADGTRTRSQLMVGSGGGTAGDDTLVGSALADSIQGLDGNDSIQAGLGNDTLGGGAGYDAMSGGAGDDRLSGGPDSDGLAGNGGNDTLDGGAGEDRADFSSASAAVNASLLTGLAIGEGTDQLISIESLTGGAFGDVLTGNDVSNELSGMEGNDSLYGGGGADRLYGGTGDDLLDGGDGRDTAYYYMYGATNVGVDADLLRGTALGEGADILVSIEGLSGSNANDRLAGDDAENDLHAHDGNDILLGRGGDDRLHGGKSNDTLTGGAGDDVIGGDSGTDVAVYSGFRSEYIVTAVGTEYRVTDLVADRDGADRLTGVEFLRFADQQVSLLPAAPAPAPAPASPGSTYNGTSSADSLYGSKGDDTLNGLGGADLLQASSGHDQLNGGDGNDTLDGSGGNDTLNGGSGADTASYFLAGRVTVSLLLTSSQNTGAAGWDTLIGIENLSGGTTDDALTGNAVSNRLEGNWGNDTLDGGGGADWLYGGTGDDTLIIDDLADTVVENPGEGVDTVLSTLNYTLGSDVENLMLSGTAVQGSGNGLNNRISGNALANVLDGGAGGDTLSGAGGNDTLTGGVGNDTIEGGQGVDVAVYAQARSQYLWIATPNGYTVAEHSGAEGVDVLAGVERLRFVDAKVALDLGGDAGFVARLAGVLFGPGAVGNKHLIGAGLRLLDAGTGYDSLVDQALQAVFGARPDNAQLVDLLYVSLMGVPPSDDVRATFTAMLEQGTHTQASLTRFAAGLELNAAHINLTGLQATGLEYV